MAKVCSIIGNVGTFCTGGRGVHGTASDHLAGAPVDGFVDANYHNQVAAEIKAIETALGAGLASIGDVRYRGAYSALTSYALHDMVTYGTGAWISVQSTNMGNMPTINSNYWVPIAGANPSPLTGVGALPPLLSQGSTVQYGTLSLSLPAVTYLSGGFPPYVWSIDTSPGAIATATNASNNGLILDPSTASYLTPTGLLAGTTLNSSTGVISGTLTGSTSGLFMVTATDQIGQQAKWMAYAPVYSNTSIAPCTKWPADNVWNQRVDGLPVDSSSDVYLSANRFRAYTTNGVTWIGLAAPHADFGTMNGIPMTAVSSSSTTTTVNIAPTGYGDESDFGVGATGCTSPPCASAVPLLSTAPVEGFSSPSYTLTTAYSAPLGATALTFTTSQDLTGYYLLCSTCAALAGARAAVLTSSGASVTFDQALLATLPAGSTLYAYVAQDAHVLSLNTATCQEYEMYSAFPYPTGQWTATSSAQFDLTSNTLWPSTYTSADASGLAIGPALVTYADVNPTGPGSASSGAITHALRMTMKSTSQTIYWPATHQAGHAIAQAIPMGARVRLKNTTAINTKIASLAASYPESAVLARALQRYGAIVTDNGQAGYVQGVPDARWIDGNLQNRINASSGTNTPILTVALSADSSGTTFTIPSTSTLSTGYFMVCQYGCSGLTTTDSKALPFGVKITVTDGTHFTTSQTPNATIPSGTTVSFYNPVAATNSTRAFTLLDMEVVDESALMVSATSGATKPVVYSFLPDAVHAQEYSMPLATGGLPPYTCSITSGSLPTGLTLTSSTCTVAGTVASATSATFGVSVTDSNSLNATGSLTLTVE